MTNRQIKYRKVRTTGDIVSDMIYYFSWNFKTLAGSLVLFSFLFFILSKFLGLLLIDFNPNYNNIFYLVVNIGSFPLAEAVVVLVVYFVAVLLHNQLMNRHLLMTEQTDTGTEFTLRDIIKTVPDDLKQHFPNFFFLLFFGFITFFLIAFGIAKMGLLDFGSFDNDPVLFIIQVLPIVFLILFVFPFLYFIIINSLFYSLREKTGIFLSIKHVWNYCHKKLLPVWGMTLLGLLLAYLFNLIFTIPTRLLGYGSGFFNIDITQAGSTFFFFLNCYTTLVGIFAVGVFHLVCVFQFGSIEEEKEGYTIKEKINTI